MDTHQWPEGIGVKGMEAERSKSSTKVAQKPQAMNCPRCNSSHTKFCYYNNYSLSQPRYFCKTCRRYWTEGGSLRNVPVGGGSRKNKRPKLPNSDHHRHNQIINIPNHNFSQNPKIIIHQGSSQDLNLAYHPAAAAAPAPPSGNIYNSQFVEHPNTSSSAMEFLKINASRGSFASLMSMPISDSTHIYASTLAFQDFKPTLNFGFEGGYENLHQDDDNNNNNNSGARLFFPYEELKVSGTSTTEFEGNHNNNNGGINGDSANNGYWNNGGLGGGSW